MTKHIYAILYIFLFLSVATELCAQNSDNTITIPFQCGFEDEDELNYWVLNERTPDAGDQWCIGNATWSEGRNSLYISANGGTTTVHGCNPNIVMAYRTLRFPEKGHYNISFDWKSVGDETRARLYVYVGRKEMLEHYFYTDNSGNDYGLLDIMSETNGVITRQQILNQFSHLSDGVLSVDCLYGSRKWQNYYIQPSVGFDISISISQSQAAYEYVLAFVWINAWNDPDACGAGALGACIDNIQIASADQPRPKNLSAVVNCEDSAIVLSWESTLAYFEVEYRNVNDNTWRRLTNLPHSGSTIQTREIPLRNEGNYNFRIRGCNLEKTDTSAYASLNNVVFWCPENHCINYINLYGDDVECRTGKYNDSWEDCKTEVVDEGEEARESRHTINWIEERYDPNTANSRNYYGQPVAPLLTIPDGSMASVRLGNWDTGSEQESITYTFTVDALSQAILIMKYAIVFEDPGEGHGPQVQPYFNITVFDENNRELDPTCGKVSFRFEDATQWNMAPPISSGDVYWKDWTSIGLDLTPYDGRTVKVRVTTKDCGQGAHFGYAYFVMDCVSAKLQTNNCGDESSITIDAPEGFTYEWRDSGGNIVSTSRSLTADAGYETYTCEACMKEAADCCFELSTDFAPRYPYPQLSWKHAPGNCNNIVQLSNLSHVLVKYEDTEVHTGEACDQIEWTFNLHGDNSFSPDEKPVVTVNPEGDTLYVKLRATLGGGICSDEIDTMIVVPSILTEDVHLYEDICEDETYIFAKKAYDETGVYYDLQKNIAGCDSVTILHLTVNPKSGTTYITDTVCSVDLPYVLNDISYPMAGTFIQHLDNRYNCDSTVILSLSVVDKLQVEVEDLPVLCADEKQLLIDWHIFAGRFDSLAIRFTGTSLPPEFYDQMIYDNTQTEAIYPYDNTILPGYYHVQLEFFQHQSCGNQLFDADIELRYAASLVEQKWNDVLAILSAAYNGGYTFTAFQWYKDDMPLAGETGPYLYQPLDQTSEYSVLLYRSDGVGVRTCSFMPTEHTDIYPFPTLVSPSQKIAVRKIAEVPTQRVLVYDLAGRLYSLTRISDDTTCFTAPSVAGHYVVTLILENEETITSHLIVAN